MIYSFQCETCGVFDKELPVSSKNLHEQPCPRCNNICNRKYYATGVVFKGTGFYVTDTPGAKHSTVG